MFENAKSNDICRFIVDLLQKTDAYPNFTRPSAPVVSGRPLHAQTWLENQAAASGTPLRPPSHQSARAPGTRC